MGNATQFTKYPLNLGKAKFNYSSDALKVALSNTLPTATTNELLTDITQITAANGYASGGNAVPNVSWTQHAAYSVTDLMVDAADNKKVTSVTHTFAGYEVGTYLTVTAGSGWRVGTYLITAVSGGAASLDSSPAATSTTGGSASHKAACELAGDAVVFTASGGSIGPFQYSVVYDSTTGYLIAYWDYGTPVTVTDGNTFTVKPSGLATAGTILNS